ncbi:MAG: ribonuclease HII [Nanoarchaeota archaeon]
MLICGIDEAGRGPVLGPMVMAGVAIEEKDNYTLVQLGVKDSKQLTPRRRKALAKKIREMARWKLVVISPQEIDEAVRSKTSNLNWLEATTMARILHELKPDKAWIDCPSVNINAFQARLEKELGGQEVELVLEHKADANFPIVGAASIIAKVARDQEIDRIEQRIGLPIGSGYPADPVTVKFLTEHGKDFPDVFRKSWKPWKAQAQSRLLDFGKV